MNKNDIVGYEIEGEKVILWDKNGKELDRLSINNLVDNWISD